MTTDLERFHRHIHKSGECWLWVGSTGRGGYGRFWIPARGEQPRHIVTAHRFIYEQSVGPIPDGLELDHLCRRPSCVNPSHLEAVTPRENTLRGTGPGGLNARKTHCHNGHPFDQVNTYPRPHGAGRDCRICRREAGRRCNAKRQALRIGGQPL